MYLHLGQGTVVRSEDLIGIFDMETSTIGADTRRCLAASEKAGNVVNVSMEMPKSFALCQDSEGRQRVYICQISSSTLRKRSRLWQDL